MVDAPWPRRVGRMLVIALSASAVVRGADEVTSVGKPISIQPSQFWDGKDGPWSTFRIQVGTPPQQLRVLPASAQSASWLVLPEACAASTDGECTANRGTTYKRNESSTWEEYGSYQLNTFLEERIGLDGDGLYGRDTMSLGWAGDGLPSIEGLMLAGMVTEDFYLGSLALNPRPNNFTDYNNPVPSLMQLLRNATTPIPSSSWSYTAGSHNRSPKVFGSLILGGYDTTRFVPNDVVFPFGADISLDFQVAIQSITSDATDAPLLSAGIISYIDTMVADIWLPNRSCQLFEDAFGLVWDEETELYLMDPELHDSLLERNPTITFKVGPEVSGNSVNIDLPYFNWYQRATPALAGNKTGLYFPLKRAANDTQYVLGRAFLQSAYLSADYERNTFNLSQALYPSSSTAATILPILTPRDILDPNAGIGNSQDPSKGLGTGALAGIAVGGAAVLAVVVFAIFVVMRRKKAKKGAEAHELEDNDLKSNLPHEVHGEDLKYEIGEGLRHEVTGDSFLRVELSAAGKHQKPAEMSGTTEIYEMPANDKHPAEMEGEGHVHEKSPVLTVATPAYSSSHAPSIMEDDEAPLSSHAAAGGYR